MENIKIKKNEEKPESKEVLADAIIKISDALEQLYGSGLNQNAVIVLLQDACPPVGSYPKRKLTKKEIRVVLDNLKRLRGWYCN